jgi:hypothetical protein
LGVLVLFSCLLELRVAFPRKSLKSVLASAFGNAEGKKLPLEDPWEDEAVLDCEAVRKTNPGQWTAMQMYHISKCGGSALNGFFQGQGLTAKGKKLWKGERENSCDPAYCGKNPGHVFILGTVRNPFGFYLSYWQMVVKDGERRRVELEVKKMKTSTANDPFEYACIGPEAKKRNMMDLFTYSQRHNATTFQRWLNLVLVELGGTCGGNSVSLGNVHRNMMIHKEDKQLTEWLSEDKVVADEEAAANGGKKPKTVYDAVVRLEQFYPSLGKALRKFECMQPGSVNWAHFDEQVKQHQQEATKAIGNFNKDRHIAPYHCFYDKKTQAMVEKHDAHMFHMYGYTFDDFVDQDHLDCSAVSQ